MDRRLSVGLSQTEVAARMGTSQSAVARLEAGEADIRLSTLERYAAAVGIELDWTLGERGR
ncbi:MAG TPA: helix-turn-helix transcriptional regulator [Acidimicrobiales bacterium]|nr:helix-turn-helix transcriptional regulator [Acidimicrobiales bacterium]